MGRSARVVVPGTPHHVTQRGNRRQVTFFGPADYRLYVGLMAEWCKRCEVQVWAYCLMPNHVHLIAVPSAPEGLGRAIGEAHRRYTRHVNVREGWEGHLWQGRFASFPMDDPYLLTAARYVELNPVRARLVQEPSDYPWSSAAAHIAGRNDWLVDVQPLLALTANWRELLEEPWPSEEHREHRGTPLHGVPMCRMCRESWEVFRQHERSGLPLGDAEFLRRIGG
jgi:putative transposase